ncbi:hypothetical protein BGZ98_008511 [Dissophora globulifera]|nr:hypothetical protein BGZ98_008511 [Dissophora globulifera]
MASNTSGTSVSASVSNDANRLREYFDTGPNHILCQVPGIDQASFPKEFQDAWDLDHVRLPCSARIYPTDPSLWPTIVEGLSESITTSQQLFSVMLRWNRDKESVWNINALDAFLNTRATDEENDLYAHLCGVVDHGEIHGSQEALDSDEYQSNDSEAENHDLLNDESSQSQLLQQQQQRQERQQAQNVSGNVKTVGGLKSQFLSSDERSHFFEVTLPRMQALALRLPELVKKPIPFLKQQQDSAITLSQEQIACLLANAFFNTLPSRNAPLKKGRKKKPAFRRHNSSGINASQQQQQQQADEDDDDDDDESEEDCEPHHSKAKQSSRGGRGGAKSGRGGRGGGGQSNPLYSKKKSLTAPRPPRKHRTTGPAAQFEFFEEPAASEITASVEKLTVKDKAVNQRDLKAEASSSSSAPVQQKEQVWTGKLASINFINMFWSGENHIPCTVTQAAKLRCILHYFDRVTTEMPTGTVTFHRQVLKKPAYLIPGERLNGAEFAFSQVTVDSTTPIEDAPPGALRLDFANRNIGGGVLEKGAVQEEILFMVCPELIVSRLFCQQMEANEAILIKGAERYSNHIGYSKTFEWYADYQDLTSRDKIGRRKTEICAIDARPFRSRISRLEQLERHYCLREINKALAGYRVSPINASEWGLARDEDSEDDHNNSYRPIATGNWGCGAFGGHLQLKFVLQWIAASICRGFGVGKGEAGEGRLGDEMLYYTFGMHQLKDEIEAFLEAVEAMDKAIDPKWVVECITQYPRRNPAGEIQGFREKSLLEYLGSALAFAP